MDYVHKEGDYYRVHIKCGRRPPFAANPRVAWLSEHIEQVHPLMGCGDTGRWVKFEKSIDNEHESYGFENKNDALKFKLSWMV